MGNKKFSWYTIVHPDYEGWPAPPIYRLVGPTIEQSGETTCDIYYKPNRKGGHRHNYLKNAKIRQRERSKELRNFWRLFAPLELPKSIETSTTTAERGSMR